MPKANLNKLQSFVIAFVVIGVAGSVGLNILGGVQDAATNEATVTAEEFDATSDPFTYTVADASESDFVELESVSVFDTTSENTELTATITNATTGEVEVQGATDADLESINYEYEAKDTEARNGADQAISGVNEVLGFLPVIGLVLAASVVISIVTGFTGRYRNKGKV